MRRTDEWSPGVAPAAAVPPHRVGKLSATAMTPSSRKRVRTARASGGPQPKRGLKRGLTLASRPGPRQPARRPGYVIPVHEPAGCTAGGAEVRGFGDRPVRDSLNPWVRTHLSGTHAACSIGHPIIGVDPVPNPSRVLLPAINVKRLTSQDTDADSSRRSGTCAGARCARQRPLRRLLPSRNQTHRAPCRPAE